LKIDSLGKIGTDSPYKKTIEEFSEDNLKAAKQLKSSRRAERPQGCAGRARTQGRRR
jgi:hypothetical protein